MIFFNLSIMLYGVAAGLVMGTCAMVLNMTGLTTLDLPKYMGCFITGKKEGKTSLTAGFIVHIIASALFAPLYLHIIHALHLPLTIKQGLSLDFVIQLSLVSLLA